MKEKIRPLNGKESKEYIENLALNFLKRIDYSTYANYFVKDAPDIQNSGLDVGIEVTQAIDENIAQIEGEYVQYRFQAPEESSYHYELIEERGASIDDDGALNYPVVKEEDDLRIITKAIQQKLAKISVYREKGFKKLALFVIIKWLPIPTAISKLNKILNKMVDETKDMYDCVYISYPAAIYVYDTRNKKHSIYKVNDYEEIKIQTYLSVRDGKVSL